MSEIPMPPELTEFDPLAMRHLTTGVCLVKKFGGCRLRNPNRCNKCGILWRKGIVKLYVVNGNLVRLCKVCLGKVI